jgi:alanine-glyoxylate transaminase/serine-glyoxylate transaminase/serine-pyruvate transaminase
MKYLLMIPGPVESPDEIIEAFNGQTVAHYGKEFRDLYLETASRLSRILGSEKSWSFLMPGSGTTGLEAIGATFCNSRNCLVLSNGSFGDRLNTIAGRYGSHTDKISYEKGKAYDLAEIEEQLKSKKYDLLWMVHVETSVGILNPVKEVAKIAKKYGCLVFVDAIASSGIEEIKVDEWQIDGIASASQKGFSCPSGLGMLTVNYELIKNLDDLPPSRSWYPDLRVWVDYYDKWNDWHPYPSTLPTNVIQALAKSLEMIESEGIASRIAMYKDVSSRLIKAIKALGLGLFVPEGHNAHGLTAVSTLGKFQAPEFIEFLKDKFRIQIGGSLEKDMKPLVFRIGHMSTKQCLNRNLAAVVAALGTFMKTKNIDVYIDKALAELV